MSAGAGAGIVTGPTPEPAAMTQASCALITGAAGALGRAAVAAFAARGDRLVLVDRDRAALVAAFPDLAGDGRSLLFGADVTDAAEMTRVAAEAARDGAVPELLVHVAGGFEMGPAVHELDRDSWQRMLDLNAWSLVACARAFVPAMLAAGRGRIVAVSARAAAHGEAHKGAYIAAKSALQRLVETLSLELRERGIAVNSVAPSVIDTAANRAAMPGADPGRWVRPDTLAQCLVFLASPAGGAIHGQHLVVSGLS
jgi:NAD(P)-dependent dehydrogenase (short-subunit alcohol dehydrogenase family)